MKKTGKIERISFSYKPEMKVKLLKLAKADNRSLSSYIQLILANHIANKTEVKKKRKKNKKVR